MQILITALYAAAMVLSAWGVIGPLWSARLFAAKARRARTVMEQLQREQHSDDESIRERARARLSAAKHEQFEGGPESLEQLGGAWVFHGGSTATNALEEARARAKGLGWVVAGIFAGSIASILSIWTL